MMRTLKKTQLIVRSLSAQSAGGILEFGPFRFPCALGRTGTRFRKREGDGATPRGIWRLQEARFRQGGIRPKTRLPLSAIRPGDGWCDTPADRNYNRFVRHPYPARAERLWRDDQLYDLLVVLDYNIRPRVRGAGSAVFFHVARVENGRLLPTEGCVAVKRQHMLRIVPYLTAKHAVRLGGENKKDPEAAGSLRVPGRARLGETVPGSFSER
jgi:L,D-peptidoglycan transpeptidase YkuD (ErfK/YbiS/YcfS/YnhG family)